MSQQEHSEENLLPIPEPIIQQQVENSTLGGGMQAAIGNDNIQIQGDSNVVTFNKTEVLQISVAEIKTRKFIETSPYKGLKKFEKEDKDLFFGRDQFLTSLVNELEQTNLVLLLGASGSGKSSVVRAGLVPWLFQKYGTRLVNLIFTPDQDPFESLYASLLSKNTQNQAQIAREAKADTLTQVVTRLKQADDYWFILIDQFEELFTTSQPEKRDRFIASLVQLAKAKILKVKIMATMRADFLDKLSPYPALVKATDKHRPMIAEMQPDELRLAIEQPAAHQGVVFETELVEEIIKDVQGQAGYLPLLQYTLNLLWETEVKTGSINDRTLNISTYRELGGVRGALQQRVDKIYEDLPAQEKIATQRIFLKLVDIGGDEDSGSEWKPVRRRALRFEFSDEFEIGVLTTLINNNLLVSDRTLESQQSTVEIAHETLLTSWKTLNTWIKENRNTIALRNRLNDDVGRWEASKAEDELWTGSKLEKLLELRNDATFNQVLGGFSQIANQFINDSLGLRDRQLRRARRTAMVGITLAVLASAGGMLAFFLWQESQKQNILASTQAAEARLRSDNQLDAMVESVKAAKQYKNLLIGKDVSAQVVVALQQVIYGTQERLRLHNTRNAVFSPDSKQLATGGEDGLVRLWNNTGKELAHLRGHSGRAYAVFSPDGKQLATSGEDSIVRLWDNTGKELAKLIGHQGEIYDVVFSPDGKLLATRGKDDTVRLWNTFGKEITTITDGVVSRVVFSPDGNLLATRGTEPTIKLWNYSGKEVAKLTGHQGDINDMVFSPDGKLLATGGKDKTARIWDTSGKEIAKLIGHQGQLYQVLFSPDGKLLATSGDENTARLWNTTGKELAKLTGHQGKVTSVVFSPNGKQVATTGEDSTARLWSTTGKELARLTGHQGKVESVKFSTDGQQLVTLGKDDNTVRLWNTEGKEVAQLRGHQGSIYSVQLSANGTEVVTTGEDGTARLWDISGKELTQLGAEGNTVFKVVFSSDGRRLATVGGNNTAQLWEIRGKELAQLTQTESLYDVVFSPDSKRLATTGGDGTARLWDTSGKQLAKLLGHEKIIRSVVFSPDGKLLAIRGETGTASLWDISGKELAQLTKHQSKVKDVVFSPDGKRIATREQNKTVRLWDISGKELAQLSGNQGEVLDIKFSPNSRLLATAGDNGTVWLWNSSGKKLSQLTGHQGTVYRVVFSPDGKLLATNGIDGTVRLWNIQGQELVQLRTSASNLAFSPNSKLLVTAGGAGDGIVRLWDTSGKNILQLFKAYQIKESEDSSIAVFSPDGKLLAAAGHDLIVRLWQIGDVDELLSRSCDWVRGYLNTKLDNNPDRHLCDGIGHDK